MNVFTPSKSRWQKTWYLPLFFVLSAVLCFQVLLEVQVAHAAARSTPFAIGETLDPGADAEPCGPTDNNCFPSVLSTSDEGSLLSQSVSHLDFVGSGVTATHSGATTTITIAGGGSSLWTDGGNTTYLASTTDNVAIGATSSTAKLSVAGAINISDTSRGYHIGDVRILYSSTTNDSIAVGELAGATFVSGSIENVAIGYQAMRFASTTGNDGNVAIGYQAGYNHRWDGDIMIGYRAGRNAAGWDNVLIGRDVGFNHAGSEDVVLGYQAGYNATNANSSDNVLMGYRAGYNHNVADVFSGFANVLMGYQAGYSLDGDYTTAIGYEAGLTASGTSNIILGLGAGYSADGNQNVMIGDSAGTIMNGENNVALGTESGETIEGDNNFTVGVRAGEVAEGSNNNYIGYYAGRNNLAGSDNTFMGYETGLYKTATSSVLIGSLAFRGTALYSALNNVAIGHRAGYAAQTGASNNILVGYQAGDALTTGANNIAVGYDIDLPSNTGSNQLTIGNLIYGTSVDGTGTATSSGNVGIATNNPTSKLTVAGDLYVQTNTAVGADPLCWDGSGGSVYGDCSSLAKWKTNVVDYQAGLDEILALEPVNFDWKRNADGSLSDNDSYDRLEGDTGFIANAVAAVDPGFGRYDKVTGELRDVNDRGIMGALVNAVKELDAKIGAQTTTVVSQPIASEAFVSSFNSTSSVDMTWLDDGVNDTVWQRLVELAQSFMDSVLRLTSAEIDYVKSEQLETDKLCVGDVCVTEEEFRSVFGSGSTPTPTSSNNDSENTGGTTQEEENNIAEQTTEDTNTASTSKETVVEEEDQAVDEVTEETGGTDGSGSEENTEVTEEETEQSPAEEEEEIVEPDPEPEPEADLEPEPEPQEETTPSE